MTPTADAGYYTQVQPLPQPLDAYVTEMGEIVNPSDPSYPVVENTATSSNPHAGGEDCSQALLSLNHGHLVSPEPLESWTADANMTIPSPASYPQDALRHMSKSSSDFKPGIVSFPHPHLLLDPPHKVKNSLLLTKLGTKTT